ncbi:MAG: hypothetical protein IJU19_00380 [Bacteroidales bacterium]|nr:hypothetical protein [Bacteroidales bacterium]
MIKTLILVAGLTIWAISKIASMGNSKRSVVAGGDAPSYDGEAMEMEEDYDAPAYEQPYEERPFTEKPFSYEDEGAEFSPLGEPVAEEVNVGKAMPQGARFDLRQAVIYHTLLQNKYANIEN